MRGFLWDSLQEARNGGLRNTGLTGDLPQTQPSAPQFVNFLDIRLAARRPPEALSAGPGPVDAHDHSFPDQRTLELGYSSNHGIDHLTHGRAGVDGFGQAYEIDAQGVELFKGQNQVASAAGEPVKASHQDGIKAPAASIRHESVQKKIGPQHPGYSEDILPVG